MRQLAVLPSNLGRLDIDATQSDLHQTISIDAHTKRKLRNKRTRETAKSRQTRNTHRLIVGQLIHRLLGNIQALCNMVDGQDVNLLARLGILDLVALPAGRRVPARDIAAAANVREARDLALSLVAVAGDKAVGTVGAGDGGEAARGVRVAVVVGEGDGLGEGEEEGEEGGGELHLFWWKMWKIAACLGRMRKMCVCGRNRMARGNGGEDLYIRPCMSSDHAVAARSFFTF